MSLKQSLEQRVKVQFKAEFLKMTSQATPQASTALLSTLPPQFARELTHRKSQEDQNNAISSIPQFFANLKATVPAGDVLNLRHIRAAIQSYRNRDALIPAPWWPYNKLKI